MQKPASMDPGDVNDIAIIIFNGTKISQIDLLFWQRQFSSNLGVGIGRASQPALREGF